MEVHITFQPMAKEVITMADLIRLSTRACIELSEGKIAFRRLLDEVEKSVRDGRITQGEILRIRRAKEVAVRELDEGLIAAERADLTHAINDWRSKAGEDAELPRHLRDRKRDLDALCARLASGTDEDPKPAPTMTLRLVARKRPVPLGENGTGRAANQLSKSK